MSAKHTPGPWSAHWLSNQGIFTIAGEGQVLNHAHVISYGDGESADDDAAHEALARANAALIAAAPDLLESARRALDFLRATKRECPQNGAQDEAWATFIQHLEKAIAKAEGRAL